MTAKILKSNGEYICHSTLHPLSQEEVTSAVHDEIHTKFMVELTGKLGLGVRPDPLYDNYEDDNDNEIYSPQEHMSD